jgi:O-antigen/teichoic acid export membrane protein
MLSILMISYLFLSNGIKQAVSKNIAVHPLAAKTIFYKGLSIQCVAAACLAVVVSGFSQEIATFFKDANLVSPLRYLGAIILFQGALFVIIGSLNGLRRFFAESIVFGTYSIARAFAVVLLVWLGFGVDGAVWGFLIASMLATAIGFLMSTRFPDKGVNLCGKDIWGPAISNIVIFAAAVVLLNIDLLFIKRLLVGSDSAGLYTAAAAFSKIPHRFLYVFGAVSFPLVASSFNRGNMTQCRAYVSQVFRYSTLIFLPAIVIISATSEDLLTLFYGADYQGAGPALTILIFGVWFVGISAIIAHLMIAIGKGRLMALMSLSVIVLDAFLNMVLIPRFGLTGAAFSTSLSAFIWIIFSGAYIATKIGLDVTPVTAFRLVVLSIMLYLVPQIPPLSRTSLLIQYPVLYAGFILALFVTREVGPNDWAVLKRMVRPRAQA